MNLTVMIGILLLIISAGAQSLPWWVFDNGGGMQILGSDDTAYVSIGQTAIGEKSTETLYLGAGYLYIEAASMRAKENSVSPQLPFIRITPNPFNTSCLIVVGSGTNRTVQVEVYDVLGKSVASWQLFPRAGVHTIKWNPSNLPSGIYVVKISTDNGSVTKTAALVR